MPVSPGTKLGPYEIVSPLGAGGMGEVYRARDTKLNRDVAIKVLPEMFALDADRVARFTREAQVLASLNHPNIAQIFGIEGNALVMELVEGHDLSEMIGSAGPEGPALQLTDTLQIARQIADALEAAHELGIVHRDLKPANVKVRADGTVKVLDFGLAKAMDPAGAASGGAMNSPTMTARNTQMGMIIGTAAYMSPEQAKGRVVDKRADIWAFGVVLCEMLTGQRVFKGEDVSDTLASVLKDTPDLATLPAGTPAALKRLIARCLDRDIRARLRDIGEARVVLEELARGGNAAETAPVAVAVLPRRSMFPIGMLAVGLLAVGAVAGRWIWSRGEPGASSSVVTRLEVLAPAGVQEVRFAVIAPDGSFVVFLGRTGTTQQLYVRRLDDLTLRRLDGTEGAELPFVSFDAKWIGFSRANHLEKIAVNGGDVVRIADISVSNPGSAWGPGDRIIVTRNWYGGLSEVSAGGGDVRTVTTVDTANGEKGHWFPQFLPDGRHVIFTVWRAAGGLNDAQIAVLDLSTGKYKAIMPGAHGSYVAPGFLVFYRAGAYQVVRFDLESLSPSGEPVTVLTEDRGITPDGSNPTLFAAFNGTVVYVPNQYNPMKSLAWVSEGGAVEPLPFPARSFINARIAPKGGRIATGVQEGGRYVVRLLDLGLHTDDALDLPGSNWVPEWNPDGRRLAMRTMLRGDFDIYAKDVTTSAPPVLVLATTGDETPAAWLSDQTMIMTQAGLDGLYKTKRLDLNALDRPTLLSEYNADDLSVSPDRKWIALAEPHSGRSEIYVRRVEGDGVPERVTANGGTMPAWLPNGRELVYLRGQDIIALSWREEGGRLKMGGERVWAHLANGTVASLFEAGLDGRVLVGVLKDAALAPQVRIILNWQHELARKLAR